MATPRRGIPAAAFSGAAWAPVSADFSGFTLVTLVTLAPRFPIVARGAPRVLAFITHTTQASNESWIGLRGSRDIDKHVKALMITHGRNLEARPNGFFLASLAARGM